jgi:hypothetical protein
MKTFLKAFVISASIVVLANFAAHAITPSKGTPGPGSSATGSTEICPNKGQTFEGETGVPKNTDSPKINPTDPANKQGTNIPQAI